MNIQVEPRTLSGTVSIPASKSMTHRMLICAALAEGTLAYGIRLKYNAYHTDGDDLPNRNFNIYSIILMGKDDVPEPTVAPSEPEEPTPKQWLAVDMPK